ncbi:hypothetical protein EDF21_3032 [Frigoribacterium sp. PhB118]|nr:hypothetical protein EDF21_3032 [Frigoribacterium sp. PhB118]
MSSERHASPVWATSRENGNAGGAGHATRASCVLGAVRPGRSGPTAQAQRNGTTNTSNVTTGPMTTIERPHRVRWR